MCCGCSACENICPVRCISMTRDNEGFLYPIVDNSKCVDCGLCEKVCIYNKEVKLRSNKPDCYAMIAKDSDLRFNSSSGGIFSLIANLFLKSNSVVYGVAMDENNKSCSFARVTEENELYKLRGSKYLQADANDVYKQVKNDLEKGNKVLFSGVPCQINALHLFLNRQYDNLFCVEVVCHGVPSPTLWEKYTDFLENNYNTSITSVSFRNKKKGWKNFSLEIAGYGFLQSKNLSNDPYIIMFLKNYSLRPSCFNCKVKTQDSMADLTIADYWGIHKILPDMDDDKGTSLVMINTKKGRSVFEGINELTYYAETPYNFAVLNNSAYCSSPLMPRQREKFFNNLNKHSFDYLAKKYGSVPLKKKIKRKIVSLIRRRV